MQLEVLSFAAGLLNPIDNQYLVPASPEDEWMCTSQIMERDDYTSFSILGLVLIFVLGVLLMIINCSLDSVVRHIRSLRGSAIGNIRNMTWRVNDTLHLQSIAYDTGDVAMWKHHQRVPVTVDNDKFLLPSNVVERYHFDAPQNGSDAKHSGANQNLESAFSSTLKSKNIDSGTGEKRGGRVSPENSEDLPSATFLKRDFTTSFSSNLPKKTRHQWLPMWNRRLPASEDKVPSDRSSDIVR